MRILVVGGTGFIGSFVVEQLAQARHEVAVFHRGNSPVASPPGVRRILGDRKKLAAHRASLQEFRPDVVVDVILSSGAQAKELMDTCRGVARRVVALSSMDVYRACGVLHGLEEGPLEPLPLTEDTPLRSKLQTYPPQQIKMLPGARKESLGDLCNAKIVLPRLYDPCSRVTRGNRGVFRPRSSLVSTAPAGLAPEPVEPVLGESCPGWLI